MSKNIFDSYQTSREHDQQRIDAVVTGRPAAKVHRNKTTMTLSITEEDKRAVKRYAVENGTTVSDLLHEWIVSACAAGDGEQDG